MAAEFVGIIFLISGAGAELWGIALVVLEVRDSNRAARKLLESWEEPAGPTRTVGKSWRTSYRVHGREPSLEERVERLEQRVEAVATQAREQLDDVTSSLREELVRTGTEAMTAAGSRDKTLRDFISSQLLTAGARRRKLGAVVFAIGVALNFAGNLVLL